jgi:AraC family transcriptional regulator, regulatory protein of adaptative response / DNA-3-methyladenine glycosylase II
LLTLTAKPVVSPKPAAAGKVTVRLRYRAPDDWQVMISFLAARAVPGMELVDCGAYSHVIDIDGEIGAIQMTQARDEDALIARVRFRELSRLPAIIVKLRRVFDLPADPQTIKEHLLRDTALAPLIAARPGLRVPVDGMDLNWPRARSAASRSR